MAASSVIKHHDTPHHFIREGPQRRGVAVIHRERSAVHPRYTRKLLYRAVEASITVVYTHQVVGVKIVHLKQQGLSDRSLLPFRLFGPHLPFRFKLLLKILDRLMATPPYTKKRKGTARKRENAVSRKRPANVHISGPTHSRHPLNRCSNISPLGPGTTSGAKALYSD